MDNNFSDQNNGEVNNILGEAPVDKTATAYEQVINAGIDVEGSVDNISNNSQAIELNNDSSVANLSTSKTNVSEKKVTATTDSVNIVKKKTPSQAKRIIDRKSWPFIPMGKAIDFSENNRILREKITDWKKIA